MMESVCIEVLILRCAVFTLLRNSTFAKSPLLILCAFYLNLFAAFYVHNSKPFVAIAATACSMRLHIDEQFLVNLGIADNKNSA